MVKIDKALKEGKLVIGYKSVKKALVKGLLKEIMIAKGGEYFLKNLKALSTKTPIKMVEESPIDLGVACKKPFNITVLGVRVEKKK